MKNNLKMFNYNHLNTPKKILPPLRVGQSLIIELKSNEKHIGTLFKFNDNRLRLKDVQDYSTKEPIGSCCIYYVQQIITLHTIDDNGKERKIYSALNGLTPPDERSTQLQRSSDVVKLTMSTINQIYDLLKYHTYINTFDRKYFDAVKLIKRQRVVGLNLENVKFGRLSAKAALLTVVTDGNIFIFDLLMLGGFSLELKEMLVDERPMKVIHHAKCINDYLVRKEGIAVNNIFDTMVSLI